MTVTLKIRTLLAEMEPAQIFTTRDLIGIGSRAAIDQCLRRMVESGIIQRLASGVFANSTEPIRIDPAEVARIKAAAFHKEVFEHPETTAQRLRLVPKPENSNEITFATNGSSSTSFMCGGKRIHLKAVSARKRSEHRDEVWELLKALWHLGKVEAAKLSSHIKLLWNARHQKRLQLYASFVPQWLLDMFPRSSKEAMELAYMRTIPHAFEKLHEVDANCDANKEAAAKAGHEYSLIDWAQSHELTEAEYAAEEAAQAAWQKNYCYCPDSDDCICDLFTCDYCQTGPIRNRFALPLIRSTTLPGSRRSA